MMHFFLEIGIFSYLGRKGSKKVLPPIAVHPSQIACPSDPVLLQIQFDEFDAFSWRASIASEHLQIQLRTASWEKIIIER